MRPIQSAPPPLSTYTSSVALISQPLPIPILQSFRLYTSNPTPSKSKLVPITLICIVLLSPPPPLPVISPLSQLIPSVSLPQFVCTLSQYPYPHLLHASSTSTPTPICSHASSASTPTLLSPALQGYTQRFVPTMSVRTLTPSDPTPSAYTCSLISKV